MLKRIPWNKGLKFHFSEEEKEIKYASRRGIKPWNAGKTMDDDFKQKVKEGLKNCNKTINQDMYKKIGDKLRGKKRSKEVREKISKALKGKSSPMKGKKFTDEHRKKIAEALKGNKNGLGKICSEEKKLKISKTEKGKIVSKESIEKCLATRKKNGTLNTSSSEAIAKAIATKKKNCTLNSSIDEKEIEKLLKEKFLKLKTQYKSELYPFHCDFYIPELDLYIEYQGHWSHGKFSDKKVIGPFDKNNKLHIEVLNKWKEKAKTSKFYKIAIDVWTRRDPLKRETAKINNLNWLEFFTIEEFMKWYKENEIR